jgi:hypothetical protein
VGGLGAAGTAAGGLATASGLSQGETGAAWAAPDDAPSTASMSAPETMTERMTIDILETS